MDPALVSQIANAIVVLFITYGAVYFGQYKGLLSKINHLEADLKNDLADNVVTPDEVKNLQADFEDLRAEFEKIGSA